MARTAEPQRRGAILAAARATFLERGFTQTRMTDVAARAGVAPGTIYLYFDSKEAIVLALAEDFYSRLHEVTLRALEDPAVQGEPASAISAAVRSALDFTDAERDLLKLTRLDLGLTPGLQPSSARQSFQAALAGHLAGRMNRGEIFAYDPAILADLISGMIERAIETRLLTNDDRREAYEAAIIELLRHALINEADDRPRRGAVQL